MINPDTIKAQMEGGIVYGLTAALKGEITIQNGRVVQRHFNDYPGAAPQRDAGDRGLHRPEHGETPGGIGEPSTALAAGSLVNAIAAATGKRIYTLPDQARAAAEAGRPEGRPPRSPCLGGVSTPSRSDEHQSRRQECERSWLGNARGIECEVEVVDDVTVPAVVHEIQAGDLVARERQRRREIVERERLEQIAQQIVRVHGDSRVGDHIPIRNHGADVAGRRGEAGDRIDEGGVKRRRLVRIVGSVFTTR